ncbi:META domain-containing protein [Streptomyces angustmyceticus]|uniref:META domain-containing protein n=1 Tax=Streptomyces angustmyceticus TaxID=285578 RepID=UPI0037FB1811
MKKRPPGAGGLLSEGVWKLRGVTIRGREESLPSEARAWIALYDGGTAAGDYGCRPFRKKAVVTAARLRLGEELDPLPSPSASPAAPVEGPGPCQPDSADGRKELTDFEEKVAKVLKGELSLSRVRRYGETLLQLRNQAGDGLSFVQVRGDEFFKRRWSLRAVTVYDGVGPDFAAGDQLYFDFHENGEVTGNLGCNDFTANVTFSGLHLFFHDPVLTTDRRCDRQVMSEEANVLKTLKKSLNYAYGEPGSKSMTLTDDLGFPGVETGLMFSAIPRR